MRTSVLGVLCVLLAMVCWAETMTAKDNNNHLRSTIKQTMELIKRVKQNGTLLCSPTINTEECCSQYALQCFNSQLLKVSTSSKQLQHKLWKNLNKANIMTSIDNCAQKEKVFVTCKPCDSYPMVDNKEFLQNLLSLLQKSFSRLS